MAQPMGASTKPTANILWRCPECGHIFTPQPNTIRCPQCGENLRKCRYCQFADTMTWECTNARIRYTYGDELGRFHIPEPDHVWACPENRPALQPNAWQLFMANPLLRALGWGAGIAVGLLLLFRFVLLPWIRGPEAPEAAQLTAQLNAPAQVATGEAIRLTLTFSNYEAVAVNQWLLVLESELVEDSEPPQVTPPPIAPPERVGRRLRFFFNGSPPGGQTTVELVFNLRETHQRAYQLTFDAFGYLNTTPQPTVYRVFFFPSRRWQIKVR
jgi:hypothetical protein